MSELHIDSLLIHAGRPAAPGSALNHPIAPASNFLPGGEHWYSRADGTDTVTALEEVLGRLDGGAATAFGSGMAAVAAVVSAVPVGGRIAVPVDAYHGTASMIRDGSDQGRWEVERIEASDTEAWVGAVERCDLVWLESPSNPRLDITDLPAIAGTRGRKAVVAVDSTFATPLGQQPLALGADVVVHSVTKFIGGHSDLVLGVAVTASDTVLAALRRVRALAGAAPGSLEAFLALRGVRTLALRFERAQANASELAGRLQAHPAVRSVRYPGLTSDPGHVLAASFMSGFGGVLSFEVADDDAADRFVSRLELVVHATSLGGVETTAERRSGYPDSDQLPPGLIRMSVGCESVEDLWSDLDRALSD